MRWLLFLFQILQIRKLRDQLIDENFIKSQTAGFKLFNLKGMLFWPPKKLEYYIEKMTNSLIIRKKVNENKTKLILYTLDSKKLIHCQDVGH